MVSVQSAVVGGNDVGFEEAGGQGCSGEGEHYRLVEPHLAVVPMKMRKPALNGVRLGPKFLVSYRPIKAPEARQKRNKGLIAGPCKSVLGGTSCAG